MQDHQVKSSGSLSALDAIALIKFYLRATAQNTMTRAGVNAADFQCIHLYLSNSLKKRRRLKMNAQRRYAQ